MHPQILKSPDPESGETNASRAPTPPPLPPTILVVEDEEMVRTFIIKVLQRAGYKVVPASNGQEAILSINLGIDLIITDLNMPEMDGMELVMLLRKQSRAIPIIAISGAFSGQSDEMLRTARLLGAKLTLSKPFEMSELIAAVSHVLSAPAPTVPH